MSAARRRPAQAACCLAIGAVIASGCGGSATAPSPVARPAPPVVREMMVAFDSPGARPGHEATLCGTLSLPDSNAPIPGVVLVHGSGPVDRDEVVPATLALDRVLDGSDGRLDGVLTFRQPLAVFRDLAHALTRRGYAVLRYDKRTWVAGRGSRCGPTPAFDPFTFTMRDLVADSAAAAAALRRRPEVDGRRVFVLGHSEGAHVALALAGAPEIAGVASLAGPGRPIDVELLDQFERVRAYYRDLPPGASRDEAVAASEGQLAEARDAFTRLRRGTFGPDESYFGVGRTSWLSWFELSDHLDDVVAGAMMPLLLLGGSLDFNVPPASFEILRSAARPQDSAVLLPGHTHALTDGAGAALPQEAVSSAVIDAIAQWMDRVR